MTGDATEFAARKAQCRRQLRALRRAIPRAQREAAARRAAAAALRLCLAVRARRVGVYLDCGSELPTSALIRRLRAHGIAVAAPRIGRGHRMQFVRLGPSVRLRRNAHGIAEPLAARPVRAAELDVILLPLLGYDAAGNRLGAGGGYYDRLFARLPDWRPLRFGLAFAVQGVRQLPTLPYDRPLHGVITERGITRFRHPHHGG